LEKRGVPPGNLAHAPETSEAGKNEAEGGGDAHGLGELDALVLPAGETRPRRRRVDAVAGGAPGTKALDEERIKEDGGGSPAGGGTDTSPTYR
jgi:hypothetical protein